MRPRRSAGGRWPDHSACPHSARLEGQAWLADAHSRTGSEAVPVLHDQWLSAIGKFQRRSAVGGRSGPPTNRPGRYAGRWSEKVPILGGPAVRIPVPSCNESETSSRRTLSVLPALLYAARAKLIVGKHGGHEFVSSSGAFLDRLVVVALERESDDTERSWRISRRGSVPRI